MNWIAGLSSRSQRQTTPNGISLIGDVHSIYDHTGNELKDVNARLHAIQRLKPVYDVFKKQLTS